jgi:hypothetical protein
LENDLSPPRPRRGRFVDAGATTFLFLAGIVLPIAALLIESSSHRFRDVFFDPIPSPLHVVLIALVPFANLIAAGSWDMRRHALALTLLNGAALGVAGFYSLVFLPLMPLSIITTVILLGFLGLSPSLAFVSTLGFRQRLAARAAAQSRPPLSWWWTWAGAFVALSVPVLVNLPTLTTAYGLTLATSDDEATRERGVHFLRELGSEQALLEHCYERPSGNTDVGSILLGLAGAGRPVSSEAARPVYYQVTGRPFNAERPPPRFRSMWEVDRRMEWSERGGEEVAGALAGLTLAGSRLDGTVDADAAQAYLEWTLTFENRNSWPEEARTLIQLPHDAVVSRLTLWVDGEEREAAFAGRRATRDAYERVVRARVVRDPVLATSAGPDLVLVQCFPVPAHGKLRTRIGITVPLVLDGPESAALALPRFAERNFGVDCAHDVWIDAHSDVAAAPAALRASADPEGVVHVRGALPDVVLAELGTSVRLRRSDAVETWTPAIASAPGLPDIVRQSIRSVPVEAPAGLVVVIDGSRGLAPHADAVADALASLTALAAHGDGLELGVFVAGDRVERLLDPVRATATDVSTAVNAVRAYDFVGGRDSVSALTAAIDVAVEGAGSAVLWLHGPQPLLSAPIALEQVFERARVAPRVLAFQVAPGSNELLRELDGFSDVEVVPRVGSVGEDLARLISTWVQGVELAAIRTPASADAPELANVRRTSGHLARLWAHEEALALGRRGDRDGAAALATAHQLVTPLTGAVVLETRAMFDAAGLAPVDPATVPSVPEPETVWLLLVVGAALVVAFRSRVRA